MSEKANSTEVLAHVRTADGLAIQLRRDPIGVLEVPELENVIVGIHLGSPTRLECRRGGRRYTGTAIHGDIDIIPAGTPSRWEIFDENDTALFLSLPKRFLTAIANQSGVDSGQMELLNRFQIKDRELEVLGWAIKESWSSGILQGVCISRALEWLWLHAS